MLIIFGEIAPKTFGALYPERIALPAAVAFTVLLKALYPIVWLTNLVANGVLRVLGVSRDTAGNTSLSSDEVRTVVAEASTVIPHRHQRMLMSILDLERINVEDIMVPRHEINGIDAADDWDEVLTQIRDCRHTRIPVYDGSIDTLIGILHMKKVAQLLARGELDRDKLLGLARAREPYYVPEGTPLNHAATAVPAATAARGLHRRRIRRRAGPGHARGPARGNRWRIHLRTRARCTRTCIVSDPTVSWSTHRRACAR